MTKVLEFHWDTVDELVSALATPIACASNVRRVNDRDHSPGWICAERRNITTYDQSTAELAKGVFNAGVKLIEKLQAKLDTPTPVQVRRVPRRGPQGDELDMPRVWQGELDTAWRHMARENRVGPTRVLITLALGASAYVGADELAMRGAAALALADKLRQAGYVVGIAGWEHAQFDSDNKEQYIGSVTILEPGRDLDIQKTASMIASGLLFRGVMLHHMKRVAPTRIGEGTGQKIHNSVTPAYLTAGYDYVAQIMEGECKDAREANDWLDKQVAALNPA